MCLGSFERKNQSQVVLSLRETQLAIAPMVTQYRLQSQTRQVALRLLVCLSVISTSSCVSVQNHVVPKIEKAQISKVYTHELLQARCPEKKIVVALYPSGFMDNTGQRKSNSETSSFSTAITQDPSAYLIRALDKAGLNNCGF